MSARSCMGCLNLVNEKRDADEASLFYLGCFLGSVDLTKVSGIFFSSLYKRNKKRSRAASSLRD